MVITYLYFILIFPYYSSGLYNFKWTACSFSL